MIAKIVNHCEKRNGFGGALIALNEIRRIQIPELIDKHLGNRPKQARYKFSDIITGWHISTLCGAGRLDDVEKIRHAFKGTESFKLPSHDCIGGVFKSLATKTIRYENSKTTHEFNIHESLNTLMVNMAIKTGLLKRDLPYTLDYDNTIIQCHKYDATKTYERSMGYQPGVSFIGQIPVGIENRNGNSPAVYRISETVGRTLNTLDKLGIKINVFRSDAAAYQTGLMQLLEDRGMRFFIRYRSNHEYRDVLKYTEPTWRKVIIGSREYGVTSLKYSDLKETESEYRVVVARRRHKNGEYTYRGIITNDLKMEDGDVIRFYNQRGGIERHFDDLKNHWSWSRLPFSFLAENTVFLIISALGYIIYQYLLKRFSTRVGFVKRSYRLKRFTFAFIICPAKWIGKGECTLKMDTDRDYGPLIE